MTENVLRDKMEKLLKRELRSLMLKTRADLELTQSKMGDRYVMSENSYSALENGEYMCGTLTTIFCLGIKKTQVRFWMRSRESLNK